MGQFLEKAYDELSQIKENCEKEREKYCGYPHLVTVLLVTYNHIDSFDKAIQSVLCQKTNFSFQIIVLDDASTDGTSELIKKYEHIPNIKIITREKNTNGKNTYLGLKEVNTKYYAILETDDYWSDENKLQIQVDILENNPDCSFCAHNTLVNYISENRTKSFIDCKTKKFSFPPKRITKKYYIEPHTSSRLYRSECLNLDEIKNPIIATYDIASNFYFLTKGNLYYIDKVMSVYNYTSKGIYSGASSYSQRFKSANVINQLNEEFNFKYNYLLARFFSTILNLNFFTYLQLKSTKKESSIRNMYQKLLDSFEKTHLNNWRAKPIIKINFPIGKTKRIVFELRSEKER